jgi:hypothetical protein
MIWHVVWRSMLVGGILLAVALQASGADGQATEGPQPGLPTYAIPLKDGRNATVWWDAVSDPARPGWRCEVPTPGAGREARTTIRLTAAAGDWRAALAEAKAALKGLVTDSE